MNAARHRGSAPILFALVVAGLMTLGAQVAHAVPGFPQAKINHVDTSAAPMIKVHLSFLDKRLRVVDPKRIKELELSRKPKGSSAIPLFSFVDGEPIIPGLEEGAEPPEPAPTMTLEEEEELRGAAIVVVAPGYADPAYRDGDLGVWMKGGIGLFFKKLSGPNAMNIIWVSDTVRTWVRAKGRTKELSSLDAMRPDCAAWTKTLREDPPEPPEEDAEVDPLAFLPKQAECGLQMDYATIGGIVEKTAFEGFFPHLFGLRSPLCQKPEHVQAERRFKGNGDDFELEEDEDGGPPSGFEEALRLLVEEAEPGQPRILILVGDGRDGYAPRLDECRMVLRERCRQEKRGDGVKAFERCVDERLQNKIVAEQEAFKRRAVRWIALAKAAGIRVYSVVNPNAKAFERDRMVLLAQRTGGTPRVAESANDVVDLYSDLIEELNGQMVLTFEDPTAVPGAALSYEVRVKAASGRWRARAFKAQVAGVPEGLDITIMEQRAALEAKLGPTGFLALVIVVALIVGLILLKILMKLGKKIFGKAKKKKK